MGTVVAILFHLVAIVALGLTILFGGTDAVVRAIAFGLLVALLDLIVLVVLRK